MSADAWRGPNMHTCMYVCMHATPSIIWASTDNVDSQHDRPGAHKNEQENYTLQGLRGVSQAMANDFSCAASTWRGATTRPVN